MKKWIALAFIVNVIPSAVNGFWITGRWPFTPLQHFLADLVQFVALPVLTLALLLRLPEVRDGLKRLNWPAKPGGIAGSLLIGVLTGACGYWLFRTAARLIAMGVDAPSAPAGLVSLHQFFATPALAAVYFAGTAALTEEFVFRYLPFAYLAPGAPSDRGKWLAYVAASCVLFGLIHWENGLAGVVAASLWGLLLGFMFWAFRNPVTVVTAHLTANLIAFWPAGPSP